MGKTGASKYMFLGGAIVALVFFGFYFFNKNNNNKAAEIQPAVPTEVKSEPILKLVDRSLVAEKIYNQPNAYTVFNVTYPQFKNVSPEFNKKIEDVVTEGIANQKKDSADNWKARYDTRAPGEKISQFPTPDQKFSFNISWEPTQVNSQFISFILIVSGYTGGAHGYQNTSSFNYDVTGQREITLADLFPNNPNYLKTISEFSIKDLSSQFRQRLEVKTKQDEQNFKDSVLPMLLSGTQPSIENFSVFTFTSKEITFYFGEYQVAPYAMGESKVVFPR